MRNLTKVQQESILLDAAILFANYGEADQREIGITRGGVEFNVTENVRDIEYDGRRGKTKGMEVVDEINAYLKVTTLEISNENLFMALGGAELSGSAIINNQSGIIPDARYLTNITAFGIVNKTGAYKKITIYNAQAAGGITLSTTDKGEATIELTLNAHWNPLDVSEPIYKIEDSAVAPADANTLRALTVISEGGSSATTTIINVLQSPRSGAAFVYKTAASTAPTVTYQQDLSSGWTLFVPGQQITPTATHTKITVAEVDAQMKAVGAGSTTIVYGA